MKKHSGAYNPITTVSQTGDLEGGSEAVGFVVHGQVVSTEEEPQHHETGHRRIGASFLIGFFCALLIMTMVPSTPSNPTSIPKEVPVPPHLDSYDGDNAVGDSHSFQNQIIDRIEPDHEKKNPQNDEDLADLDSGVGEEKAAENDYSEFHQEEEDKTESEHSDAKEEDAETKSWWQKAADWITGNDIDSQRPTKLSGGGRDWLISATKGTVIAKHNPALFLGIGPTRFVLVPKGDDRALYFHPSGVAIESSESEELSELEENEIEQNIDWMRVEVYRGMSHADERKKGESDKTGAEFLSILNPTKPGKILQYSWYDTVAAPTTDLLPTLIRYKDDNFVTTQDDFVLDVENWNVVQGSRVNFVRAEDGTTFTAGGGRDFIWNENETLSPKLNSNLVLGADTVGLVLTENLSRAVHLINAQDLADGKENLSMEFYVGDDVQIDDTNLYTVTLSEEGTHDNWRYCTAKVSLSKDGENDDGKEFGINYDGNFLLTSDNSYALDVAYWNMENWTPVNFVGGNDQN